MSRSKRPHGATHLRGGYKERKGSSAAEGLMLVKQGIMIIAIGEQEGCK